MLDDALAQTPLAIGRRGAKLAGAALMIVAALVGSPAIVLVRSRRMTE